MNNWHKCATKEALFSPALLILTTLLFATGHNHPCERTEPFSSNRTRHRGLFRRRGRGGIPLSIMFRKYALARKRGGEARGSCETRKLFEPSAAEWKRRKKNN